MKEITAVDLRRSLATLAATLESDGQPILIKLGATPVAVIVSLRDFRERFTLQAVEKERQALVKEMLDDRLDTSPSLRSSSRQRRASAGKATKGQAVLARRRAPSKRGGQPALNELMDELRGR